MKKTLTKDIIKTELNKIYLHDVIKYGVLLLLCVAYLVLYFFKPQLSIYNPKGIFWMLSPLYVFIIVMSVINLYKIFKAYPLTQNNKIDIVFDVLVDKRKKAKFSRYRRYHHTYTFIFDKTGEYKLKKHILTISNPYHIDNEQLYDISQIHDKFFVVVIHLFKRAFISAFFEDAFFIERICINRHGFCWDY